MNEHEQSTQTQNQQTQNTVMDTTKRKDNKKTFLILSIIALIISIIRIPYLLQSATEIFSDPIDMIWLVIGIAACVLSILLIIFHSKKPLGGIIGIITGLLIFISGEILGNIIGILLIIDSIRELKTKK